MSIHTHSRSFPSELASSFRRAFLIAVLGSGASLTSAQTLTTLATFNGSNGATTYAGLALSGNTLYGTTYLGGANGYGTLFALVIPGPVHRRVLHQHGLLHHRFRRLHRHLPRPRHRLRLRRRPHHLRQGQLQSTRRTNC